MPPTLTRTPAPPATSSPGRTAAGWAAAGVAALLGAVAAGEVLEPPPTVDLVVANESAADVTIVVDGADGGPILPVATIDAGEERTVEEVLDQGRSWVLTFRVAGEDAGQLEVSRSDLAGDGFRIVVPAGTGRGAAAPEAATG